MKQSAHIKDTDHGHDVRVTAVNKTRHFALRLLVAGTVLIMGMAAGILVWTRVQDAQAAAPKSPRMVQAQPPAPKSHPNKKQPESKQATQPSRPAQIDRNGVLILIRETVLALDQANKTGNYSVLRDLGSLGFQANSSAQLAEIFANQRNDHVDLSGVAVIDPQLTLLPQIESNGMMRMAGFFPMRPTQVNFELLLEPVGGTWRLFGLSVRPQPSSAGASPQAQASPPAPPTSTEQPKR